MSESELPPIDPWRDAAQQYSSMDERGRHDYWRRLTPDQQTALTRALAASSGQPSPAPPAKGTTRTRSCAGMAFSWGCIGLLAVCAAGLVVVIRPVWLFGPPKPPVHGPWCVAQITNPLSKSINYNYGWFQWSGPSHTSFPTHDPGETRRLCVDLKGGSGDDLLLQFDIDGLGVSEAVEVHRFNLSCTLIQDSADLEVAPVKSYHFEDLCNMTLKEDGHTEDLEWRYLRELRSPAFFCGDRTMSDEQRKLLPKGVPVLPKDYRHPPLGPLLSRCN